MPHPERCFQNVRRRAAVISRGAGGSRVGADAAVWVLTELAGAPHHRREAAHDRRDGLRRARAAGVRPGGVSVEHLRGDSDLVGEQVQQRHAGAGRRRLRMGRIRRGGAESAVCCRSARCRCGCTRVGDAEVVPGCCGGGVEEKPEAAARECEVTEQQRERGVGGLVLEIHAVAEQLRQQLRAAGAHLHRPQARSRGQQHAGSTGCSACAPRPRSAACYVDGKHCIGGPRSRRDPEQCWVSLSPPTGRTSA